MLNVFRLSDLNVYLNILTLLMLGIVFFVYTKEKKWWRFLPFKETLESLQQKQLFGFDQSVIPKMVVTELGEVTQVNDSLEALLGWREIELKASGLGLMVPPRFLKLHSEEMKGAIGKPVEDRVFDVWALKKSGVELPVKLILRKRNINGNWFYGAVFLDNSKEVALENENQKEIADLKRVLDILSRGEEIGRNGSWLWDVQTKKVVASTGYKIITGLDDKDEYDPKHLRSKIWEDDLKLHDAAIDKAFAGERYDIEYKQIRPDTLKALYLHTVAQPICNANGLTILIYGSTRLVKVSNIKDLYK